MRETPLGEELRRSLRWDGHGKWAAAIERGSGEMVRATVLAVDWTHPHPEPVEDEIGQTSGQLIFDDPHDIEPPVAVRLPDGTFDETIRTMTSFMEGHTTFESVREWWDEGPGLQAPQKEGRVAVND